MCYQGFGAQDTLAGHTISFCSQGMLRKLSGTSLGGKSKGLSLVLRWENVLLGLSIKDTHINTCIKIPQFYYSFPHHILGHHS